MEDSVPSWCIYFCLTSIISQSTFWKFEFSLQGFSKIFVWGVSWACRERKTLSQSRLNSTILAEVVRYLVLGPRCLPVWRVCLGGPGAVQLRAAPFCSGLGVRLPNSSARRPGYGLPHPTAAALGLGSCTRPHVGSSNCCCAAEPLWLWAMFDPGFFHWPYLITMGLSHSLGSQLNLQPWSCPDPTGDTGWPGCWCCLGFTAPWAL